MQHRIRGCFVRLMQSEFEKRHQLANALVSLNGVMGLFDSEAPKNDKLVN